VRGSALHAIRFPEKAAFIVFINWKLKEEEKLP
jgi:hypothetical protein